MAKPVIIIGAGGHAKVVANALQLSGVNIIGLTDANNALHGTSVLDCPVLGNDEIIRTYEKTDLNLVVGIGSTEPDKIRRHIFERFLHDGYSFLTCVHPSTIVASDVELGIGTQIMAGAIVQPGCKIGMNSIINTSASVDHDCRIGDHAHIAPGTVLGGTVIIGDGAHIGTNATVIENVFVGSKAMVAAGACVISDISSNARFAGIPAKAF